MTAVLSFLAQRRKAIAYIVTAGSQLVAELIPQTNPQNALVLHTILALLGLLLVHGTPNDAKPADLTVTDFIDDLIHGDGKHEAAPVAVPAAPLPGTLQG